MELRFPLKLSLLALILPLVVAACQQPQRTEFVMEVTREVTVVVVVTATPEDGATVAEAQAATATTIPVPTHLEVTPSPTSELFPTPVVAEVIVAEQQFERGRMFYVQPIGEIWVMYDDPNGLGGEWQRHEDTWQEGMPELDASIVPPDGLAQPIRGFGKLWRDNEEVRSRLGWAIEPEFGHVTQYRYEAGGEIVDGEYVRGPGVHLINSRDPGTTFIFDEASGRWSIAADPSAN